MGNILLAKYHRDHSRPFHDFLSSLEAGLFTLGNGIEKGGQGLRGHASEAFSEKKTMDLEKALYLSGDRRKACGSQWQVQNPI